jgi:NDP-sugar pyrophosphorylase family protein
MEKPTVRYEASMGIYCFSPRVLEHIEEGETLDFPDLVLKLIAAGEVVRASPTDGYWLDIGRHDDYEAAQAEFEELRARLIPDE